MGERTRDEPDIAAEYIRYVTNSLDDAATNGNVEFMKEIIEQGIMPSHEHMRQAIENGHVGIVHVLYPILNNDQSWYIDQRWLEWTARCGQTEILDSFISMGKVDDDALESIFISAVREGQLDFVRYMLEELCYVPGLKLAQYALEDASIALSHTYVGDSKILETISWMIKRGCTIQGCLNQKRIEDYMLAEQLEDMNLK